MQSSLRESHIQRGRGLKPPCCALNSLRSGSTQQGDIFHVRFFAKQKILHRIYPRPRYAPLGSLPKSFIINWVWWVCISSLKHWFSPSKSITWKALGPPQIKYYRRRCGCGHRVANPSSKLSGFWISWSFLSPAQNKSENDFWPPYLLKIGGLKVP